MKQGYTHYEAVIDHSGSMKSIKKDSEGGFNTLIEDQKGLPGEATITLTEFDDEIDIVWDMIPLQDAPAYSLVPRGWTALLDAVGIAISRLGVKLAAMAEEDRPEKTIFIIVTDGDENKSQEYTYEQIAEMIKTQTDVYSWEFMFLGANIDAIATGARLGISRGKSMTFAPSSAGVGSSYASVSSNMMAYRSAGANAKLADFSDQDRSASIGLDPGVLTAGAAGQPQTVLLSLDPNGRLNP